MAAHYPAFVPGLADYNVYTGHQHELASSAAWTKTKLIVNMVQVIFFKPNFLSDAWMELTCSCAQMKAEKM